MLQIKQKQGAKIAAATPSKAELGVSFTMNANKASGPDLCFCWQETRTSIQVHFQALERFAPNQDGRPGCNSTNANWAQP